jgi:hypothetical protein
MVVVGVNGIRLALLWHLAECACGLRVLISMSAWEFD